MQITLDSSEIKQAIVSFVRDQGIDLTNTDVEVGMTAGRGVNGTTATVDIIPKRNTTGVTGVKTTFHSVTNLTPGQTPRGPVTIASAEEEEEALDEEISDPELNDSLDAEETEEDDEDAPVAATNSIFK
jgi:hypothetical protein